MSDQQNQAPDAESLSALFDGQLGSDPERFALKRLGQDAQWREACGRWQLAGDVLRGNSVAPVASGFADRVMLAVAQEPGAHQPESHASERGAFAGVSAARGRARHHPRWMGGALAASVAIAALLVARPMLNSDDVSVDAPTEREVVSASPDNSSAMPASGSGDFSSGSIDPDSGTPNGIGAGIATAAVAAVAVGKDTSRRGERRRQPMVASAVSGSRTPLRPDESVAVGGAAGNHPISAASENLVGERSRPFMPTGVTSKPWPRALVSGYPAGVAITAGFHVDDHGAVPISFYPFEPAGLRGGSPQSAFERDPAAAPKKLPEPAAAADLRH